MSSSSLSEPPPFQEAPRCYVCNCSFNTFRRRHHCRCCGRTLCNEHSSNQMALPQFGILTNVRVCYDCFNNSSRPRSEKEVPHTSSISATTETFSRMAMNENADEKTESNVETPISSVPECKCGMPLCICEAPTAAPVPLQLQSSVTSTVRSNQRPKRTSGTQQAGESKAKSASVSTSKPSLFFNLGQETNGNVQNSQIEYEVNGEGAREAIKNQDITALKKLLNEGVDANFCDKQGLSLLHLAAVFNQTEIAFVLMDHGASLDCKNAQGETPLDCAPTMLQYKMRKRIEESA
ncbi:hypothetical protein QJS10_CPB19g02015 [Acorus calamus]|uniref:FYVE-type domain-containing protein n=1 Tax=Acorus calamus TaxID=4465 RepID=A0AAV9CHQ6_ACOCL|nr:hypothetical protein QJS10_CPB19g02015 [Acorus calamus]